MARKRPITTGWLSARAWAFSLVFVLMVQLVGSALAMGGATTPQRDAFGNIICSTTIGASGESDGAPAHHSGLMDCCTFACSMFWPQLPGPEGLASLVLPSLGRASLKPPRVETAVIAVRVWRAADPRAPPSA